MEDLSEIPLFIQLALGIVTGGLTGLTGASGMSVLISVLLAMKTPAQQIVATTFAIAGVNATFAIFPFLRKNRPAKHDVLAIAVPASLGGVTSYLLLARDLGGDFLGLALTGFMFLAGLHLVTSVGKQDHQLVRAPAYLMSVLAFMAGGMIGVFGGGGAIFITIGLVALFGYSYHHALMLSLLVTVVTCAPLIGLSYVEGNLSIWPVLIILASSLPCALVAATYASRVPEKTIKRLLGVYLVCISLFLFGGKL